MPANGARNAIAAPCGLEARLGHARLVDGRDHRPQPLLTTQTLGADDPPPWRKTRSTMPTPVR